MALQENIAKGSPKFSGEVTNIPVPVEKELVYLTSLWKEDGKLIHKIDGRFSTAENPYTYILNIICYGRDARKSQLPPLIFAVCQEFKRWVTDNKPSQHLTLETKTVAIEKLMNIESPSIIQLICELFEIKEDLEHLKPDIDNLLSQKKYKQGCYLIMALNIQECFPFEEVVFPLLCQNNVNLVHQYLDKNRALQLQFVKELDTICENEESVSKWISCLDMQSGNKSHFRNDLKWLQKILSNYIKKYNIPLGSCKNLVKKRSWGALNYLFHKFFVDRSMSEESFKEMIMADFFSSEAALKKEILTQCLAFNRADLALELSKALQIPSDNWPDTLRLYLQNELGASVDDIESVRKRTDNGSDWDDAVNDQHPAGIYLTLPLDESDIIIVDSVSKFEACIHDVSLNYDLVGIDAEWRPSMGLTEEIISLLQIATWDNVYLIDVLSLLEELNEEHWFLLMDKIFSNPEILKLGFGIQYDLDMLSEIVKKTKATHSKPVSILDFDKFFRHICSLHKDLERHFAIHSDASVVENDGKGLAALCLKVIGKPLYKGDQFSDWKRRPLRKSQIIYAALDAYCLLQIFEKLYAIMAEYQLCLRDVINDYLLNHRSRTYMADVRLAAKTKKSPGQQQDFSYPPIYISLFKVVVDSNLAGLGRQLRIRGADVRILDEAQRATDMVKIYEKEKRIVIASGNRFERIRRYVPPEMILNMPHSITASEQVGIVCKHFNVICTVEDVLSRCTICNCNEFLKVSSEDLQLLWTMKNTSTMSPKSKTSDLVPFIMCSDGFITEEGVMQNGKEIQMSQLSSEILLRGHMFFICKNCGKIYWEGGHHQRTKNNVFHWIKQWNNEDQSPTEDTECIVPQLVPCSASSQGSSSPSSKDISQTTKEASISYFESDAEDEDEYDVDDIVYS